MKRSIFRRLNCSAFPSEQSCSTKYVCIEDILSLEAAAKLYLNRAEAISVASLGWFTDTYGRQTGMRSLESAMDQICRDWASSMFVYAVSAARQAVMTVLVHGEDIHDHGFPTREQCGVSRRRGWTVEHNQLPDDCARRIGIIIYCKEASACLPAPCSSESFSWWLDTERSLL